MTDAPPLLLRGLCVPFSVPSVLKSSEKLHSHIVRELKGAPHGPFCKKFLLLRSKLEGKFN